MGLVSGIWTDFEVLMESISLLFGTGWKKFHLINGDEFVRMEDFGMDADHVKKFKELILPSKGMKEGLVFDKTFRVSHLNIRD